MSGHNRNVSTSQPLAPRSIYKLRWCKERRAAMARSSVCVPTRRRRPQLLPRRSVVRPGGRSVAMILLLGVFFVGTAKFCLFPSRNTPSSGIKIRIRPSDQDGDHPAGNPKKPASFYSDVFRSLTVQGLLSPGSRSLCVGSRVGDMVFALKENGVHDAVGTGGSSPLHRPLRNDAFDFVFADVGTVEGSMRQGDLAAELQRTLKPGGFLVMHTSSAGDRYSFRSLLALLPSCAFVRSREIAGAGTVTEVREIALRKDEGGGRGAEKEGTALSSDDTSETKGCSIPRHKRELLKFAEPLTETEPLKPWSTSKRNVYNIKYLPLMTDISFKRNYVYIDVGARDYESSIGSWFQMEYPKQNRKFEIFALEADATFYAEYATKEGIKLIPFAAWLRNETLSLEASHDPYDHENKHQGSAMGRIRRASSGSSNHGHVRSIQGIDFAEWLKNTVTETDFVVVKMDVEGTEFDLIPRLYENGALCLIDEMFLKCTGERSPKYQQTYDHQCLKLFHHLRKFGILVHQWW